MTASAPLLMDKPVSISRMNPSIEIESVGLTSQEGRKYLYHILLRIKEGSSTYQYTYAALLKSRIFPLIGRKSFRLSQVYPTSVSPSKYHDQAHNLVKEALAHLLSDLSNW